MKVCLVFNTDSPEEMKAAFAQIAAIRKSYLPYRSVNNKIVFSNGITFIKMLRTFAKVLEKKKSHPGGEISSLKDAKLFYDDWIKNSGEIDIDNGDITIVMNSFPSNP